MKSMVTISATAVILAGMLLFSIFLADGVVTEATAIEPTLENTQSQVEYVVAELDGVVVIFVPNSNIPIQRTEIDVRTLPQEDQENLKEGISLYSKDELAALMEDFNS